MSQHAGNDRKIHTEYRLLNGNGKHQKEGDKHQSANFDKMHANKPAAFKSGDR
jgi:hypothetical protein